MTLTVLQRPERLPLPPVAQRFFLLRTRSQEKHEASSLIGPEDTVSSHRGLFSSLKI